MRFSTDPEKNVESFQAEDGGAAERLRQLSVAVEQSPVSVVITDLAGRIVYVNPWFVKSSGYEAGEVMGKNPRILKSGEMSDATYRVLWQTLRQGRPWHGEFHNRRKDGSLFWERAVLSPIRDGHGKVTHYLAVKEDVTALKNAERERDELQARLFQAQKLETIGTLAAGIAHDFNHILSGIIGFTELAMGELEDARPQVRADLDQVKTAALRARNLVQQILTFSRQTPSNPQPLRLGVLLDEVAALLRPTLPERVRLVTRINSDAENVRVDETQMHQVLMNLCTNALHAMPEGGTLELALDSVHLNGNTPAASVGSLRPGRHVKLSVRDTGVGMDERTRERIFEPFFTTKKRGHGTGMGLALVHGIITAAEGALVVESEPGSGTRFDVYLPICGESGDRAPGGDKREVLEGSERVLLVDDDPAITHLCRRLLSRLGYHVVSCEDPFEGLEIFRATPSEFDLVITDLNMPGLDGAELINLMRSVRADLPAILATGMGELAEVHFGTGGVLNLSKPFTAADLAGAIRQVMRATESRA